MTRKKTAGFGRRGSEQVDQSASKVTAFQRLKMIGVQWLQMTGAQKKKDRGAKSAFKSSWRRP